MKEITSHRPGLLGDKLKIVARGEPGPGGAHLRYHITTVETPPPIGGGMSAADLEKAQSMLKAVHDIEFQSGNPAECVNGISNEALLAIVADRLEGFAKGPFSTPDTFSALNHVNSALSHLHCRTAERAARGVEGQVCK